MRDGIETNRLILRPFEASVAESAFGRFRDPVVMRFTPMGPDKGIEETKAKLRFFRKDQHTLGFSKWPISDRTLGVALGDSGLLVLGKGIATEVTPAFVRTAFLELGLTCLGAFVHPENHASIRAPEKLRFKKKRRGTVFGMDSMLIPREK